jgi:hypothetical protein
MNSSVYHCAVASLLSSFVFLSGCGGGNSLVPVTGKVLSKGQPAAGATLLFHPAINDVNAQTASAVADENGVYTISSGLEKGILPGSYSVTVTWPDPSVKPTQAQIMMGMVEPGPDMLKGRYSDKNSTTLKVEITGSTTEIPPLEVEAP